LNIAANDVVQPDGC